jgi:8-oxo-dGTP pyrophosphatase MutT (NUDIX family)
MGTQDGGAADGGSGRRRRRRRRRKPAQPGAATQPTSTDAHEPTTEAQTPPKARPARKTTGKRRKKKPPAKTPGKGPVHKEVSAGGVVYRRVDDGIEVVLASRRTRRGELAWGLAKGGIEEGESHEEAAVREVQEETGLTAEIEASLGETKYFYVWEDTRIRKTVHFFLMRHTGGDPADHDDEMEEIRWFPLERAMKRAAYRGEREVIGRAAELLR